MASNLLAMASSLRAMASNLRAMACNLRAMAPDLTVASLATQRVSRVNEVRDARIPWTTTHPDVPGQSKTDLGSKLHAWARWCAIYIIYCFSIAVCLALRRMGTSASSSHCSDQSRSSATCSPRGGPLRQKQTGQTVISEFENS